MVPMFDARDSRMLAGMSYLGILALVPFMLGRQGTFELHHARNGIVLWIWEVLAVYALVVPGVGRLIFQASTLACFVLSVYGLVAVILGQRWRVPVASWISDRIIP
ncbi:MAG: hypothetical protein H7831_09730 [Magnetococcus sp. WYHC-3]